MGAGNRAAVRDRESLSEVRALAGQAFSRAAGAPLVAGNEVRLLSDARENYPAWLAAIAAARRHIHFESYIIHDDAIGYEFAAPLDPEGRLMPDLWKKHRDHCRVRRFHEVLNDYLEGRR